MRAFILSLLNYIEFKVHKLLNIENRILGICFTYIYKKEMSVCI